MSEQHPAHTGQIDPTIINPVNQEAVGTLNDLAQHYAEAMAVQEGVTVEDLRTERIYNPQNDLPVEYAETLDNIALIREQAKTTEGEFVVNNSRKVYIQAVTARADAYKVNAQLQAEGGDEPALWEDQDYAGIVDGLARDRQTQLEQAATDEDRQRLRQEVRELREYTRLLDGDSTDRDRAIEKHDAANRFIAYTEGMYGEDASDQAGHYMPLAIEAAKQDRYYAKYAPEVIDVLRQKQAAAAGEASQPDNRTPEKSAQEPQTIEEKTDAYMEQEMKRMYGDPDEVRSVLADARHQFSKRHLTLVREKVAQDPSPTNQKMLEQTEREWKKFLALSEFVSAWTNAKERGEETKPFDEYMHGLKEAEEAEITEAVDSGVELTPERHAYFDKLDAAHGVGWSSKSYALDNRMRRYALAAARERIHS
ncbi:MAG TPA: hypothetical protein VK978_03000 [Candidatus Saccharimonadales bacterium]|nr:hypothetical protein [Candidatus Saccharimonadales bacterium]